MEIKNIVKEICETEFGGRAEYIINFLRYNNLEFNVHKYSLNSMNIELVFQGNIPEKEIIFLSHYDIYNEQTEGANDNSSSVAVLLALSKFLYFFKPFYTVRIVFNDSEELLGTINIRGNSFINNLNSLEKIGSYQYLKNIKNKVIGCFILELCGIGDSLYFAESSGDYKCDSHLNEYLKLIAVENDFKFVEIPIALTDFFSVNYFGFKGTVLGAIPYIEGCSYKESAKDGGFNNDFYPHIWKKNHTSLDKYFSIQERSLNMVYEYMENFLKNLDKFKKI